MNKNFFKEVAAADDRKKKEREYWLNKLSGISGTVRTSYDYSNNRDNRPDMANMPFQWKGEVVAGIMKICGNSFHRVHMVLVAGLTLLLYKYDFTGNQDIIMGTPIYKQEVEGQLLNSVLVLRNRLNEKNSFKQLILQVKDCVVQAVENQNYPVESLLYHLDIPFTASDDFPLFDTALLLENIQDREYLRQININMIFSFSLTAEALEARVEYQPLYYRRETIRRMIDGFGHLLRQALLRIDTPLKDLDILTEQDKKQLLEELNQTRRQYGKEKTIVEGIETQVEIIPDAIALEFENQALTYRELNQRSNQLAGLLRKQGVQTDNIVVIMMERSIEIMVGITGILKAGGAYCPMDPEAPLARIASMLGDVRGTIVLTGIPMLEKFMFTTLQGLRRLKNKPLVTSPRPPIQDLDTLPYPDRSLTDYGKYNQYIGQSMAKNIIGIQASRGCPYHCAYCHKIWPKKHVFRSAEHIFSEVKLNYDMGMRKFAFADDIFNLDRKNSMKFFQLILREGLDRDIQFYFPNGLRGDILTKDYIDLMVEAGTVNCALALETASPRLQKLLKKNLDLEKFRENIEYFCDKHPSIILELFTMHGFPSETEKEALMTLEFIKSLKWVHFPYINMLKIYPNTDMEQLAIQNGITRESIFRSENYAHFQISDNSPLEKNFTLNYRSEFLYNYFLLKERLLQVLPHQIKRLTEDEIIQKYNSYLPTEITDFENLLQYLGIKKQELKVESPLSLLADSPSDFHLKWKQRHQELSEKPSHNALRIMLLDLSQFFTSESDFLYDVKGEAPLGMLYLLTYLEHRLGSKINGKIAKSRMDFDSYTELKTLLEEFQPQVIGLRSLSIYKDFFHRTLSIIRQWGFEGPVIAGGPYATSDMNTVLQDKNVDLVVLGEGEITFSEVIRAIMKNNGQLPAEKELKTIPGIAFIPKECEKTGNSSRDILMMEVLETSLARESVENLPHINQANDLAYSIFTSGSTGKPKGVMVRHCNVHNLVNGLNERVYRDYPRGLTVGLVAPFYFDASVKQIFAALLQGHRLCILPEWVRGDGHQLLTFYNTRQIDISDGTPILIRLLLESSENIRESGTQLGVKHFLIGGEALPKQTLEAFFNRFGKTGKNAPKITNVYGPSECTVDTTSYEVTRENITQHHTIPIGKPLSNIKIFVLDIAGNLLPYGICGELCISGTGVGRGYINRPSLTAEKFCLRRPGGALFEKTAPPGLPRKNFSLEGTFYRSYRSYWSYITHLSYYKTGDLARWLPDGNLEFLGRIDHQVKIRGYRIELEEIENCLLKNEAIKQAVVLAKLDKAGDKYLCAYIVPGTGQEVSLSELKQFLTRDLPEYMIPTHFVQLDAIPVTKNGKQDRQALPEPGAVTTGVYAAPAGSLEHVLVETWADVLGIEASTLGVQDNFFEIGGHSLKATILVSRIHKLFNVKVPLAELFKSPTIRELARYLGKARQKSFAAVPAVEKKHYYPLTSAMKRLYFEQQKDPGGTIYNIPAAVELEGELHRQRLEKTFRQLIHQHESLRTSFVFVKDEPVQKVNEPERVEFEIQYHRSTGTRAMAQQEIETIIHEFNRPFDFSRAPLIKAALVETGKNRHVLMVIVNHMAADGTSLGLIIKDFMAIYEGKPITPLRIQYKDFSEWLETREMKNNMKTQEEYWLKQFQGEIPLLDLPVDFPRPGIKSFEGSAARTFIGAEQTRYLKEFALLEGEATLYMVMLTLYNIFLYKLSGQEDIIVGTPMAGRKHADLEPVLGMFVNTVALRNYPARNKTFRTFFKEIKAKTFNAFENQDFKFENLVDRVVSKMDRSRNPLFDVFFAFQNMNIPEIDIPGLKLRRFEFDSKVSRFDIGFHVFEDGDQQVILVEYCTKLFKKETINIFIKNFREVVESVTGNWDIRLGDIKVSNELLSADTGVPAMDLGF